MGTQFSLHKINYDPKCALWDKEKVDKANEIFKEVYKNIFRHNNPGMSDVDYSE